MHLVVVAVDGHHVVWELFLGARNMTQRCFDIREPFLRSELQRFFPALAEKGLLSHFCFWERSSPPPPPHLQAGWLCQHAEWGGVPRPSWTRCPAALHSGVGGPVEKCPSAAGRERSAARETVWSPACVWSRLTLSACVPSVTISVHASTSSSRCVCVDTSCPDAASSLDLAVKPGSEGGRRRTRRYLPGGPGAGRKTSERFRTQPITANEMEESSG